jgi:hypothetical protein
VEEGVGGHDAVMRRHGDARVWWGGGWVGRLEGRRLGE